MNKVSPDWVQESPSHSPNAVNDVAGILQHLSQGSITNELALELSHSLELCQFQFGERLFAYHPPQQEHGAETTPDDGYFYIICQGRVRLLGFDPQKQREVSGVVLAERETFGADSLLFHHSSPYCAIAASPGFLARIPVTQLQPWFEQIPQFKTQCQQQAQQRQDLIFLKTLTELRSLNSHTIKQLLAYLVTTKIPAGETLTQLQANRCWLRQGEIVTTGEKSPPPPTIGESWGYPQPIPAHWIAKTDLWVYKLPREHVPSAQAIAPILSGTAPDSLPEPANHPTFSDKPLIPIAVRMSTLTHQTQVEPTPQTEPEPVVFPQPTTWNPWGRGFWQRYPLVLQQSSADCGAACLSMIGRYWGKQFSINTLRELAGVGRAGASLKGLSQASERLGFRAAPVRASLNRLRDQNNPWIAHWQGNHYIVVYQDKGDRILIADPAVGKRLLPRAEFINNWTGYALLLDPTPQLAATPNEKNSLGRFLKVLWPHRILIGQILLASLLLQIFSLITPLFTQIILDRVVVNRSFTTLNVFALGLVLFNLWRIGLSATRQYFLDYFANRLDLTFISGFINHALSLPLKFFESRQVGDIITRVQEAQKIQAFLTRRAVITWLDTLMVFVYLGLMVYYNWKLTLLVLALIPPIAILTVVASPLLRQRSREIFQEDAGQNSQIVEMISGIGTVKASAAERELRWRWEDRLTKMLNVRFKAQILGNFLQSTSGLINSLGSTALLWYGATLVMQEQLTIGQFVAFNMLIGNVISPILALVSLWDEFQEVLVSVERLNDVFFAQPEEHPQKPLMGLPQLKGEVEFDHVFFRYGEEEENYTLENISFQVSPGQTVAIVGRSGSGKSTLVKLLQGLYHPDRGKICVDGHDIRHVSPPSLRSQLGVVPQECFLFSGTILENITLYHPEFTLEQVIEVAKLAEAHGFIQSLPLGYNTPVGERGSTLSGGQKQRIAIARALLNDPRIIILDEATSSLDTESERRFQQNLARISRNRTTLIIAHRLSTVRHADCILVLDRGILVEQGTHDQLIAIQGLYYHLAQQQLDL
jgi:ATP-binding cassette subfamily B protein